MYNLYYFSGWEGNIEGFMRLWVNDPGFEMPIYVTCTFYANILGFEMPRYITHELQLAL